MIDFNIDIKQKSPHLDLLESLKQQSHALNTIHNPKTWCLSALTYALHLNDCLVLFEDLKNRWQQELPFAEAWDVDFRLWKSEIWSAVNNTQSATQKQWKSLCDTDYKHFIELSNNVADGKISIAPLIEFVKGKETSIENIIVDAGRQLCNLFSDIDNSVNNSSIELYQNFYIQCVDGYFNIHNGNEFYVNYPELQPYEMWKSSKTDKILPSAIQKLIISIENKMDGYKAWNEIWEENYNPETREINHEGIARHIFVNRNSIIKNKQNPYKENLDRLFYTITMIEKLSEEYKLLISKNVEPWVDGLLKYVAPLKEHNNGKDFDGLWNELISEGINLNNGNGNIFEFKNSKKGIFNRVLVLNIIGEMHKLKMFSYSNAIFIARALRDAKVDINTEKTTSAQINSGLDKSSLTDESKKKIVDIIGKYK